jgi:hypothetical protein
MTDFAQRLALHNAEAELEALKAEGRGMVWANERAVLAKQMPPFAEMQFTLLAARLRETKVQIDDAVLLEGIRG